MFTDLSEEMQLEVAKAYIQSKGQCAGALHVLKVGGIGDLSVWCRAVCPSGRHHCMAPSEMWKWATDFVAEAEKRKGLRRGRASGKTMLSSIPLVSTPKKEDSMGKWGEGMINVGQLQHWGGYFGDSPTVSGVPIEMVYGERKTTPRPRRDLMCGCGISYEDPVPTRKELRMEILDMLKIE